LKNAEKSDPATVVVAPPPGKPIRKPEPRVLHGYTLTKDITFREVCYAIRDSAFVTSDLPVIVSLEVHTSLEQQATMVEIMTEAWKGLLVELTPEQLADLESGKIKQLPSPAELKNKLLIKVKWAPAPRQVASADSQNQGATVEAVVARADEGGGPAPADEKKPPKILHALSNLGVYTQAHSFRQFTQPGKLSVLHNRHLHASIGH
jgi:hypothetical protein